MPSIELDQETYERLAVAARLMNEPISTVVRRLVDGLAKGPAAPTQPADEPVGSEWAGASGAKMVAKKVAVPTQSLHGDKSVPIHKVYKGHRVEGTFNVDTHEVRLSTAPWTNNSFPSPTAAAVAVVDHYSGDLRETPNTNGRLFWKLSNGKNLRSIIGSR
jgi:hypothetical protein